MVVHYPGLNAVHDVTGLQQDGCVHRARCIECIEWQVNYSTWKIILDGLSFDFDVFNYGFVFV